MTNANELAGSRLEELLSLDGRTAVVTGSASGIGLSIVKRLHEAGARVVVGDLDAERAEAVAKDVDVSGKAVIGRSLDASDAASIRSVVDETVRSFGRLDIWVNNAGVHPSQAVLETTDEQLDFVLNLNLRGVFIGAREAAMRMAEVGGGVIVNIVSVAAFNASNGANPAHYVASKHGVAGLTKSLAVELGPRGIRAVAVAPTLTETPGVEAERAAGFGDALDAYAAGLPLGRLGHPDDVACVVLFAASDLAAFVSGSVIAADGGDLAR
ncbi:MAG: SDR family oxidoreductase [Actinomycetota bacterium]|nr:SDR family oxidoreductase [Actinomycetota bacterium]